jgi:Ca2+-binding RTX toxin-like protein
MHLVRRVAVALVAATSLVLATAAPSSAAAATSSGDSVVYDDHSTSVTTGLNVESFDPGQVLLRGTLPITPGVGCTPNSATEVLCTQQAKVVLLLGSGRDGVNASPLTTPVSLDVTAGAGDDQIAGSPNADTIRGGDGVDQLTGNAGNDVITGDAGNDTIVPGPGSDSVNAGDGDDLVDAGEGTADVIDCGPGNDRANVDALDSTVNCEMVHGLPTFLPTIKFKTKDRTGKGVKIKKLQVTGLSAGDTVSVACAGKKCPFSTKDAAVKGGKATLTKLFKKKSLRKVTIDVLVRRPGYLGYVRRFTIEANGDSSFGSLCVAPGSNVPSDCV